MRGERKAREGKRKARERLERGKRAGINRFIVSKHFKAVIIHSFF